MLRREVGVSSADVGVLTGNISRLGGYAVGFLDHFDLGLDRTRFEDHLERTKEQLRAIAAESGPHGIALRPPRYADRALLEDPDLPWNYAQTLRFAAGACMISQKYHRWMTPANIRRSMTAKVLYKCQTGILDDIVDKGGYGYLEAKELYHLVLSSMTDPALSPNAFMKRLMTLLRQEQLELFDTIVSIATNFNLLFNLSAHGSDFFYEMEVLDERVALGQALTMFQKEPTLNLKQIASIARSFYSPDDGLSWHERLANYVSGGTRYNMIDISFVERKLKDAQFRHLLRGWYYFDVVIVYLNNVVNVYQDLREGIVNLSLVAMREKEVLPLRTTQGYRPELSVEDYEGHLLRLASLAGEGLEHATRGFADRDQYYPFITVMMPVVMMADWIGKNDEMIHAYVEALAPAVRRAAERAEAAGDETAEETAAVPPLP